MTDTSRLPDDELAMTPSRLRALEMIVAGRVEDVRRDLLRALDEMGMISWERRSYRGAERGEVTVKELGFQTLKRALQRRKR